MRLPFKTHTLARQLQLLLPGVLIWLDVVNLEDISKLEEYMDEAAVTVIFLSRGYFASRNCRPRGSSSSSSVPLARLSGVEQSSRSPAPCAWECRRELRAAIASNKPIVAVIEADKEKGGERAACERVLPIPRVPDLLVFPAVGATVEELKAECREHCGDGGVTGDEWVQRVLDRVFALDPIPWVRAHDFQLQSVKMMVQRALPHLPFYVKYPLALEGGLKLRGDPACILGAGHAHYLRRESWRDRGGEGGEGGCGGEWLSQCQRGGC